jgi:hypothetical protein
MSSVAAVRIGLLLSVRLPLFLVCASLALAQGGTDPKLKAVDYDVQAQSKGISIGAEFMIHSVSGQGQTYITKEFLVVEVALYPPKGQGVTVNEGAFALRINGKKPALAPVAPALVASSLHHPDWQTPSGPQVEAGGGVGTTGVILGRPAPSQIPGQPVPQPAPQSRIPRVPAPDYGGPQAEPRVTASELVVQMALPEGESHGPVSGFLYFPFGGKTASIKSLELIYEDAVLKLR